MHRYAVRKETVSGGGALNKRGLRKILSFRPISPGILRLQDRPICYCGTLIQAWCCSELPEILKVVLKCPEIYSCSDFFADVVKFF